MAESVTRSLAKAEAIAKARGAALTPIRRRVLELILKCLHRLRGGRQSPSQPVCHLRQLRTDG